MTNCLLGLVQANTRSKKRPPENNLTIPYVMEEIESDQSEPEHEIFEDQKIKLETVDCAQEETITTEPEIVSSPYVEIEAMEVR